MGKFYGWSIKIIIVLMLIPQGVIADIELANPKKQIELTPESYPESRFGHEPADHKTGRVREPAGFVTKETSESGSVIEGGLSPMDEVRKKPVKLIPDAKKGIQEIALIAGDLGFFPNTFFVTRDVPVRLFVTGASRSTLCIMLDSFNVREQIKTNEIEEIVFTPGVPGKYRFYCPVNGMEGTMVVRELASTPVEKP